MDKYDLEILKNKGKEKVEVTRTLINRKLEDLSLPTVLGKQLAIHCGVGALCIALLCVVVGTILNLSCRNDMVDLITATTMKVIDAKSSNLSLSQDFAAVSQAGAEAMVEANDNGVIKDSVVAVYNVTEQKIDQYVSLAIYSKSDRLNEWYQEQTENPDAIAIFSMPEGLIEFNQENNRALVVTQISISNNVLMPEIVEARQGRHTIATWNNPTHQDPNRTLITGEFPIYMAGIPSDSYLLDIITSHKFNSENSKGFVVYDKSGWPRSIKIASQAFTVSGTDYEAHLIYDYAGLRPLIGYIIFAGVLIMGVAVVVSISQTKKIREF